MRTIKEVLRLKWEKKFSNKQVAQSCNIARSTVREYVGRAQSAGLSWPLAPDLDDSQLEALLFPPPPTDTSEKRGLPDMEYIRKELTRKSVTLNLLWLEYRQANPDGYQYGPAGASVQKPTVVNQPRNSSSGFILPLVVMISFST
jgi:hypothetical protein